MKKALLITLVVIVLAALIGPAITGPMTEKAINRIAEQASNQWLQVSVASYERSWFGADAMLTIGLGESYRQLLTQTATEAADAGDDAARASAEALAEEFAGETLKLPLAISHGPVFLSNGFGLGLGRASGSLDSENVGPLADLERIADIDSLLDVTLHTGLGLNTSVEASSPSFVAATDDGEFESKGMQIDLDVGGVSGDLTGSIDLLGGRFALADGSALSVGEIRSQLDLNVSRPYLTLGDAESQIEPFRFVDPDGVEIAFGPAAASQSTWLADDGLLAFDGRFSVDAVSAPNVELSSLVMEMAGGQLSPDVVVAYGELNQRLVDSLSGGDQASDLQTTVDEMTGLTRDALADSPFLDIPTFGFELNGEPVTGMLDVDIDGSTVPESSAFELSDIAMWKRIVGFDAMIEMPEALTMQLMRSSARSQMEAAMAQSGQELTDAELDKMVDDQLPMMIGMLQMQGMLSKTETGFKAAASFRDGQLTLNGTPIPLPF